MRLSKLLVGIGIGTVVGMLVAPKKGSELREDISNKMSDFKEAANNFSKEDVMNKFNESIERVQDAIKNFDADTAKAATKEKLENLGTEVQKLKTKVVESDQFNSLVGTFGHIANTINEKIDTIIDEVEEETEEISEEIDEEIDETAREIEELIQEINAEENPEE